MRCLTTPSLPPFTGLILSQICWDGEETVAILAPLVLLVSPLVPESPAEPDGVLAAGPGTTLPRRNLEGLGSLSLLLELLLCFFGAAGLGLLKLIISWDAGPTAEAAAGSVEVGANCCV